MGLASDGRITPVARAGDDQGYVDRVAVSLTGARAGGPTARALLHDQAQYCDDFATDERMAPWRADAEARGFRSSASLPLHQRGAVVATLNIYAPEPRYFDPERRALLEQLASDISYALDRLDEQQRLARAEQSYRALFEEASDGIFLADAAGHYVDVNAAGLRLLRYPRERLLGMTMAELVDPADLRLQPLHLEAVEARRTRFFQRRLRRGDGTTIDVEISGTRLSDGTIQGIVRDLAEHKRLVSELAAADRLATVGRYAAGIAHELNNPLTFAMLNLEWLAEQPLGSPETPRVLAETREGLKKVAAILAELRTLSRPGGEALRPVSLKQAAELALLIVGSHLRQQAAVRTDFAPAGAVLAAEGRLEQVIINLLVNASHAVQPLPRERREIALRVYQEGSAGVLEVRDSGTGIDPDLGDRVFDPFFTTKQEAGTGLGLAICRSLVSAWGGRISYQSAPGQGTTFRVEVPLAPQSA